MRDLYCSMACMPTSLTEALQLAPTIGLLVSSIGFISLRLKDLRPFVIARRGKAPTKQSPNNGNNKYRSQISLKVPVVNYALPPFVVPLSNRALLCFSAGILAGSDI